MAVASSSQPTSGVAMAASDQLLLASHHGRPTTTTSVSTTTITSASTSTTSVVATTTTTTAPTTTTTTSASGTPALSVVGNHLVDSNGKTVVPHGVNRSGTEYACVQWGGPFDGPSDDTSVAAIASWHTNVVRLGLNEDCWLGINGAPVGGLTAAQYQTDIENYVNLLHAHGLYAILELHLSAPGTSLATGQNPMPDADHTPAFWTSVANAFKGDRATIFDLFNEPYPDNNSNTTAAWTCWRDGGSCSGVSYPVAGMQTLTNAVRGTGSTNVIMLGGVQYANALSEWLQYRPTDPANQTAASFHVYSTNICNTATCWNSTVAPVTASVPVVTGEIGEGDGTANFINTYMSWADPQGLGYLAWVWDTWGCSNIVLISNYDGTACVGYGAGYQSHLKGLPG
jgi:endoglucanase